MDRVVLGMGKSIEQCICRFTGASSAVRGQLLQQLWSGYGEIVRYELVGCEPRSVVVKQIALPESLAHPRGWHTDLGHRRKLRSYEVEAEWYRVYAGACGAGCRVAYCYGVQGAGVGSAMVLQDLDAAGFELRLQRANASALLTVLRWLANFHAHWLGEPASGLWSRGSYWHLATRPDELAAMAEGPLKTYASVLDSALETAKFKTIIHGDAKIANFCFSHKHLQCAAVDFQYVGMGVGVCDLAYFLGSCLSDHQLQQQGDDLLQLYLEFLGSALRLNGRLDDLQIAALQAEWGQLYAVAWADFERFLQGWSPDHPKLNNYSAAQADLALSCLTSDWP